MIARFEDKNTLAVANDHGASIVWGDGIRTAGSVTRAADGSFEVKATHRYRTRATRTIKVTVKDDVGQTLQLRVRPRIR